MEPRRMISTGFTEEDSPIEGTLRPQKLDNYIGQQKMKDSLKIAIEAAKLRNEPLDHMLFYGPPGLGKTTISQILANEMGVHIRLRAVRRLKSPAIWQPS